MIKGLEVRTTGIDWYKRSMVEVKGKLYPIIEAHFFALENYWLLKVEV